MISSVQMYIPKDQRAVAMKHQNIFFNWKTITLIIITVLNGPSMKLEFQKNKGKVENAKNINSFFLAININSF